jgi:hypothetical protein
MLAFSLGAGRLWGLKNLSDERWVARLPDGENRDVEPGRNVKLAVGTKICFGRAEGVLVQ